MNQQPDTAPVKRNIWLRGVLMVLMGMVYQLCGTLLFLVALMQFVVCLLTNEPNARLQAFGRGLGNYIRQIAKFLSFASDEIPFPFSDWPSAD